MRIKINTRNAGFTAVAIQTCYYKGLAKNINQSYWHKVKTLHKEYDWAKFPSDFY